jgi:MFS family permease
VLATVLFGMVLAILNASVVNVAVPALREGSAVTYGQVQFVVAAYVLGYGVFLIRALDPALTRLLAFAVAGYPQAFPQITRMTTAWRPTHRCSVPHGRSSSGSSVPGWSRQGDEG